MTRGNRGFSIIELMVAVTLGLVLTVAVLAVFMGSRNAYQATSGTGALADSGRFALDLIQQSARSAGFLGCNHSTVPPVGTQNLVAAESTSPLPYDFSHAVGGYEATGTGAGTTMTLPATAVANAANAQWTPHLDATFGTATATQAQVLGSDVLVLRSSAPGIEPAYLSGTGVTAGGTSFTAVNAGQLTANQLVAISDCTVWFTFETGTVTPGTTTATVNLGSTTNTAGGIPVAMSAGAVITPVTTVVYYVGLGTDNTYPGLRRLELKNGSPTFTDEELVPGIDNMQVLYGIDTNGTQTASEYVTADHVADFNSVVSIKVAVLSASPPGSVPKPKPTDPLPTYNLLGLVITPPRDTRIRKVFTITIGVRDALQ